MNIIVKMKEKYQLNQETVVDGRGSLGTFYPFWPLLYGFFCATNCQSEMATSSVAE